jgi:hypothetical protein
MNIGDRVTVDARNRNSHGWHGVVDGFNHIPGQMRVRVRFADKGGMMMTYLASELVIA